MNNDVAVLAGLSAGVIIAMVLIVAAILAIGIVTMWRIFTKAGQPGWKCIIPIYRDYIQAKFTCWPWLGIVVGILSVVSLTDVDTFTTICRTCYFAGSIVMTWQLGASFGKSTGFRIGLILLPIVFYPILAFGSSRYEGNKVA